MGDIKEKSIQHVAANRPNKVRLGNVIDRIRELRDQHLRSIQQLDITAKNNRNEIKMARFTLSVAENSAKRNPKDADEYFDALLGTVNFTATNSNDSLVKKRIDILENEIKIAKSNVELAASKLIDYLVKEDVQNFLLMDNSPLSDQDQFEHYEVEPIVVFNTVNQIQYFHSDHVLATALDHMAVSEHGQDFLLEILNINARRAKLPAFDKIWDRFQHGMKISEIMGKLVHNCLPGLMAEISRDINHNLSRSISAALNSAPIKRFINKIANLTKVNVNSLTSALSDQAEIYANRGNSAIVRLNKHQSFRKFISEFSDVPSTKVQAAISDLDGSWMRLTIGWASFGLACIKLRNETSTKDWFSTVGSALSLAETLIDVRSISILASGHVIQASRVAAMAKVIGIFGMVFSVVVGVMDASRHLANKDYDEAAVAYVGVAVGFVGFTASLCGAAIVTGVCAIILICLAVIAAVLVDPPMANWLKRTHWGKGTGNKIPMIKTIGSFYKDFLDPKISTPALFEIEAIEISSVIFQPGMLVKVRIDSIQSQASILANIIIPSSSGQTKLAGSNTFVEFVKGTSSNLSSPIALLLSVNKIQVRNWISKWSFINFGSNEDYKVTVSFNPSPDLFDINGKLLADHTVTKEVKVTFPT